MTVKDAAAALRIKLMGACWLVTCTHGVDPVNDTDVIYVFMKSDTVYIPSILPLVFEGFPVLARRMKPKAVAAPM